MAGLGSTRQRLAVLAHGGLFAALFDEARLRGSGEGLAILAHGFGRAGLSKSAAGSKCGDQERQGNTFHGVVLGWWLRDPELTPKAAGLRPCTGKDCPCYRPGEAEMRPRPDHCLLTFSAVSWRFRPAPDSRCSAACG